MPEAVSPDPAIGVFETLLVVDGSLIELDAHLARLSSSAKSLFGAELPADARDSALEHAAPHTLGRLRLTVTPDLDRVLRVDVVTAPVDRDNVFPSWDRATALRSFVVPGGIGGHKWADREALASMEAGLPEGWLPLLLDLGGELLEASRANVFAVEQGVLVTPATDGRILPGVARARAIETARSLDIEVREESISLERLIAAGEVLLTGSVRGIEPVRCVGQAELGEPGTAVSELAAEMRRLWLGEGPLGA